MTTYLTHVISKDEHEDRAGDRARLRGDSYGMDEIVALDIVYPGWSLSKFDHSWNQSAIDAVDSQKREGRHPSSKSVDSDESVSGQWLIRQRTELRRGTLRPDRRAWLDEHYPTWNESLDDLWDRTAQGAADFYEREGRHPSQVANSPIEKKLGQWLGTQRTELRRGTLRPDRRAWLDEHYPEWNETLDDLWDQNARGAADLYEREGRHPSMESNSPIEKKLGQWLGGQRKALKNSTLRSDRRAWLDEHYPTWDETLDDLWYRTARAAADFYGREERHPNSGSKDPDEATLGRWLGNRRRALKNSTLRSDRRAWLDEHYPTWDETLDDLWDQNARGAADLYEREGRHPSQVAKCLTEKKLGHWLSTQRVALKNNTLRPDRRAWLDEHYPEWRGERGVS